MSTDETKSTAVAALSADDRATFDKFEAGLPSVTAQAQYDELYGHSLATKSAVRDSLLIKFLVANKFDREAARQQLVDTLVWRKEFKPLEAAFDETHADKFDGLGYITSVEGHGPVTWNIYGAAASKPAVIFGNTDEFIRWRVGFMERGLQLLDFSDPEAKMSQVHDYLNVSFLRMDPNIKKASRAAIAIFQRYYPELLSWKFFVNTPLLMGWLYTAMTLLVSSETFKKFVILNYASYLGGRLGDSIPESYGGKGAPLAEQDLSQTVTKPVVPAYVPVAAPTETPEAPAAAEPAEAAEAATEAA
ncbi:CRAL-TRIO domain-containing protein [Dipodascopsis tothii]|uniref:CRAL-TRIO domain-containing protein n=1 Tax=Dipodascopsis tothii TaxID=44089 RepID=UPI0034CFEBB5